MKCSDRYSVVELKPLHYYAYVYLVVVFRCTLQHLTDKFAHMNGDWKTHDSYFYFYVTCTWHDDM